MCLRVSAREAMPLEVERRRRAAAPLERLRRRVVEPVDARQLRARSPKNRRLPHFRPVREPRASVVQASFAASKVPSQARSGRAAACSWRWPRRRTARAPRSAPRLSCRGPRRTTRACRSGRDPSRRATPAILSQAAKFSTSVLAVETTLDKTSWGTAVEAAAV